MSCIWTDSDYIVYNKPQKPRIKTQTHHTHTLLITKQRFKVKRVAQVLSEVIYHTQFLSVFIR